MLTEQLFADLASGFLLITIAGEDGEAGILGKARISEGEFAQGEN